MKANKYTYEYVVQGSYGSGWDDLTTHASLKAARAVMRAYDDNESYPHRLIFRRTRNAILTVLS